MDIYIGHSSSIDFENELYRPLEQSEVSQKCNLVLPHKDNDQPFNSKKFLGEECDLFVAEVSEASTGLGIELGWADLFDVPILAVYREDLEPSNSIKVIADEIKAYSSKDELTTMIEERIDQVKLE